MERLSLENDALKAEVAALRSRTDGVAEQGVATAREQLAQALRTLDGVLGPKPGCCPPSSAGKSCSSATGAVANGGSSSAASSANGFSSTPAAAAKGCYGNPAQSSSSAAAQANGCCAPGPAQGKSRGPSSCSAQGSPHPSVAPPSLAPILDTTERTEATLPRAVPPRDTPSRLGQPARDDECCGGLFDCDALMRSAVGPEPQMTPE